MTLTVTDWIAILGALAWLPYLIGVVKNWLSTSKITVITQKSVEIGFTTFGPIFNLRIAFAVENKDIVISEIKVKLKHESGEERVLEWQGITQQIAKMKMPDASDVPYEKEHSVLAIKLNQKDIEERFIRFQDPAFLAAQTEHINVVNKKLEYLRAEGKYNPDEFFREQEMKELFSFNKHDFPWKPGKYTVTIEMKSPEKFLLVNNKRVFSLSLSDVEKLEKNKAQLELDYKRVFVCLNEGDVAAVWSWCYPSLVAC